MASFMRVSAAYLFTAERPSSAAGASCNDVMPR